VRKDREGGGEQRSGVTQGLTSKTQRKGIERTEQPETTIETRQHVVRCFQATFRRSGSCRLCLVSYLADGELGIGVGVDLCPQGFRGTKQCRHIVLSPSPTQQMSQWAEKMQLDKLDAPLLAAGILVATLWFLQTRRNSTATQNNEPPVLPYWIPWLGHALSYASGSDKVFRAAR
jgi:hypothetical protein